MEFYEQLLDTSIKGRQGPTDRIALALQRANRTQARADSTLAPGIFPNVGVFDFGPHASLQDYLRPGKSAVSPPKRG